ncbi:Midasin [Eumeta japonica]|uniref:Midasin n=1 Tax=Eumeta variegata TaxID=151549 RepID=A0A4C1ZXV5_EUMVA|nr:Midasin [Eumeta japonica]
MCNTTYSASVQALNDFVTQVIASSERLRVMQVDCGLPKEKQVSQAKNILQQKGKALADLFRYLSKMGLNYRKGLVMLSINEESHDFTLMPVDLEAAMAYLKPSHVLVHEFMSIYYALVGWSGNRERRAERTKRKREKEKVRSRSKIPISSKPAVRNFCSKNKTCYKKQNQVEK